MRDEWPEKKMAKMIVKGSSAQQGTIEMVSLHQLSLLGPKKQRLNQLEYVKTWTEGEICQNYVQIGDSERSTDRALSDDGTVLFTNKLTLVSIIKRSRPNLQDSQ